MEMYPGVHKDIHWSDSDCSWPFGSLVGCDNATAMPSISWCESQLRSMHCERDACYECQSVCFCVLQKH